MATTVSDFIRIGYIMLGKLVSLFTTICKLPFSALQKTSFKKLELHSLATETICFDSEAICFNSETSRGRG